MSWRSWLETAVCEGKVRPLDFMLADRLVELVSPEAADDRDLLFLCACLASRAIGEGSPCLPLESVPAVLAELDAPIPPPSTARLMAGLEGSPLCSPEPDGRPLVLNEGRLYLQRYANFERQLAARILRRVEAGYDPVRVGVLRKGDDDYLWPESADDELNWQAVACAVAASTRFSVITGGPGTGKTYTVVRLLLTLLADAHARGEQELRVALGAPTGKAAQRLAEALLAAFEQARDDRRLSRLLDEPWIAARMPRSASTLHRLLGFRPGSNRFRHDEGNPLELDALVVDECSMVDLALMTRLLRALKPTARLVLVGDRHQLVSVEAGNVLPELCAAGSGFDTPQGRIIGEMTGEALPAPDADGPLAGHVVELRRGFRSAGAVAGLALAVNAGESEAVERMNREYPGTVDHRVITRDGITAAVQQACDSGWFGELRRAPSPEAALASLDEFRVLAALNHGPFGVEALNRGIEAALSLKFGFEPTGAYHLRPILIVRNDYRLRLFNGDVGVVFREGTAAGRAWFPTAERDAQGRLAAGRKLVSFPIGALPAFRTCYAMTVHKSQGSELDRVTLILPDTDSPVVTRELIYTAITRARVAVDIWSDADVLRRAIADRVTRRASGLARTLRRG